MSQLSLENLAQIVAARQVVRGARVARSTNLVSPRRVRADSRDVRPGDLYWALPGRDDGEADGVGAALLRGAAGVVAETIPQSLPGDAWALVVDDTIVALEALARRQRAAFGGRVVAVAGSAGKTITRQMIDAVLRCRCDAASPPTHDDELLALPLSILRWKAAGAFAVVELSANAPGDTAAQAELAAPHVGVITNVGAARLARFSTMAGVAASHGELLESLPADGLAVLNGDDPWLRRVATHRSARVQFVGRGADCDLVATDVTSGGGRLSFTLDRHRFTVPVWGRHHLTGALSAVAVGRAFGLSNAEIGDALADFEPPPMRCQVNTVGGTRWINDAYNASPATMHAALDALREDPAPGLRVVVCDDMPELGPEAARFHRSAGHEVVTVCGADLLVACGEHADDVVTGATEAGMPKARALACRSIDEVRPHLARFVGPGDVVLLKGPRAARLEQWLDRPAPLARAA